MELTGMFMILWIGLSVLFIGIAWCVTLIVESIKDSNKE